MPRLFIDFLIYWLTVGPIAGAIVAGFLSRAERKRKQALCIGDKVFALEFARVNNR